MAKRGFTLIEVLVVVGTLSLMTGTIFHVWFSMGSTAQALQAKTAADNEATRALMGVTRELRQAARDSLSFLPADSITYRVAVDINGDGVAVDASGRLELSTPRTITRDMEDINKDGFTDTQLVLITERNVVILANDLLPDEDRNGKDGLDINEDRNANGRLDRGIWFEERSNAVHVTMDMQHKTRRGLPLHAHIEQTVHPRN